MTRAPPKRSHMHTQTCKCVSPSRPSSQAVHAGVPPATNYQKYSFTGLQRAFQPFRGRHNQTQGYWHFLGWNLQVSLPSLLVSSKRHWSGCDWPPAATPAPYHCFGGISLPTYLCDLLSDVLGALHHLVGSNYLNLRCGARAVLLQVELHEVERELGDLADGPVLHEV